MNVQTFDLPIISGLLFSTLHRSHITCSPPYVIYGWYYGGGAVRVILTSSQEGGGRLQEWQPRLQILGPVAFLLYKDETRIMLVQININLTN